MDKTLQLILGLNSSDVSGVFFFLANYSTLSIFHQCIFAKPMFSSFRCKPLRILVSHTPPAASKSPSFNELLNKDPAEVVMTDIFWHWDAKLSNPTYESLQCCHPGGTIQNKHVWAYRFPTHRQPYNCDSQTENKHKDLSSYLSIISLFTYFFWQLLAQILLFS